MNRAIEDWTAGLNGRMGGRVFDVGSDWSRAPAKFPTQSLQTDNHDNCGDALQCGPQAASIGIAPPRGVC